MRTPDVESPKKKMKINPTRVTVLISSEKRRCVIGDVKTKRQNIFLIVRNDHSKLRTENQRIWPLVATATIIKRESVTAGGGGGEEMAGSMYLLVDKSQT